MKKIIALFSVPGFLILLMPVSVSAQDAAGSLSSQAFWNFTNPVMYLFILAACLTIITVYTVIKANAVLNELGYVPRNNTNPTLKWTSENPASVAVIIILIVLTGLLLSM